MTVEQQFEIVNEPTHERFIELVNCIFETETWRIDHYDYKVFRAGLDDMWMFLNIDKNTKKIIAGVSLGLAKNNGSPIYSIGFYYCRPEHRGKGMANQLFKMAMDIVGDDNCCLTGAPAMSPLYAKRYGFDKVPAYWHMQSKIYTKDIVYPDLCTEYRIVDWNDVDMAAIHEYDKTICDMSRRTFLELWIQNSVSTKVVLNKKDEIVGYGILKTLLCNRLALAPLYAENKDVASILFAGLLKSVSNLTSYQCVLTTYPEVNTDVLELLKSFTSGEVTTYIEQRLQFTKNLIQVPEQKVFGITEGGHSFT